MKKRIYLVMYILQLISKYIVMYYVFVASYKSILYNRNLTKQS